MPSTGVSPSPGLRPPSPGVHVRSKISTLHFEMQDSSDFRFLILAAEYAPLGLFPLRLGVRFVVLLLQMLNADMRVLLRRGEAFMPQKLLDAS